MVERGLFRACRYTGDGRRQIFSFYWPGDVFGLAHGSAHMLTVEACKTGVVAKISRDSCHARMNRDADFNAAMFDQAARALSTAMAHLNLLRGSTSEERLAWFALNLFERMRSQTRKAPHLQFDMSRQDIADYLGLRIETISRTLTLFKELGYIEMLGIRRFAIRDAERLAQISSAGLSGSPRDYVHA